LSLPSLSDLAAASTPEEYAATTATEILREGSYDFVKAELEHLGLWDADFQQLEAGLTRIAFL